MALLALCALACLLLWLCLDAWLPENKGWYTLSLPKFVPPAALLNDYLFEFFPLAPSLLGAGEVAEGLSSDSLATSSSNDGDLCSSWPELSALYSLRCKTLLAAFADVSLDFSFFNTHLDYYAF